MTENTNKKYKRLDSQQPDQQSMKSNLDSSFLDKKTTETQNKPISDEAINMINQLEDQLKRHIKAQNFIEAEALKNKIREMKVDTLMKKSNEIGKRHLEESTALIESQKLEMESFNKEWDLSVNKFKQEARGAEDEMMNKHEEDLISLEEDLQNSLPLLIRTSHKITNMKKMIETLAKHGDFVQANDLKAQLSVLEQEELIKSEEQKDKKILHILNQLSNKQTNELNGLRKRVSTGYAELLKARATEHQKMITKHQNMKKSIESTQQAEISKFELAYRNYVPGETIQVKAKRRDNSVGMNAKRGHYAPSSLNASFNEGAKKLTAPGGNKAKRSVTPSKNSYNIKHYVPTGSPPKRNAFTPIRPGRPPSNTRANKSVLEGIAN